jgi:O-antigen/teichoic acid export membrane protein
VPSIKKNIIANFAGSAWAGLMGLIFVPLYIQLMGVESYGVVGLLATLQAMFVVLDLGLSQTLAREMACLSIDLNNTPKMANTTRTLEIIYWGIAFFVTIVIILLSRFLAYHWLNPEHMSRESLLEILWVMALVIGLRWPVSLYQGGLNGLQRQVLVNVLLAIIGTLQGAGAVAVLFFVQPTIKAFFLWQAVIALLQVIILRIALWRCMPQAQRGFFQRSVIREIWRFAVGMSGISLVSTILMQIDKILLSKLLSITNFGYYTFASAVAAVLYRLIVPVFTAYYPRLTELVSKKDSPALIRTYHQGCQMIAVLILPVSCMFFFFSKEILELWVHDPVLIAKTAGLISVLILGNTFHGFVHIPYALQLAHGWTRLSFFMNVIAVIFLAPMIYVFTTSFGALGAAYGWLLLNFGYVVLGMPFMFRRLLSSEQWRWFILDVGLFLLLAFGTGFLERILIPQGLKDIQKIGILLAAFLGIATSTALGVEWFRVKLVSFWART